MTEKQIVKYDLTEAAISEMRALYLDLTVEDFEDEKGFAEVELARKVVKGKRVAVEKQRKVFKADALEYGRMVDSKAKEIVALLDPIESHLIAEGDKVRNEIARIEAEKELLEKAKIQARVDDLLKVGVSMEYFSLATMTDEDFNTFYTNARTHFEAEQVRIAAEEKAKEDAEEAARIAAEKEKERLAEVAKAQKVESDRLEAVRKEQEAKEAELKAEEQRLEVEKAREQGRKDREAFEIKLATEAKAQAEKDAKEAAERALEAERQAKAEAERRIALLPDQQRLKLYLNTLLDVEGPELAAKDIKLLLVEFDDALDALVVETKCKIEEL